MGKGGQRRTRAPVPSFREGPSLSPHVDEPMGGGRASGGREPACPVASGTSCSYPSTSVSAHGQGDIAQSRASYEGDSGARSGVPDILKSLGAPAVAGPVEVGWFRARWRRGCAPDGVKRGSLLSPPPDWRCGWRPFHRRFPMRPRGAESDADGGGRSEIR